MSPPDGKPSTNSEIVALEARLKALRNEIDLGEQQLSMLRTLASPTCADPKLHPVPELDVGPASDRPHLVIEGDNLVTVPLACDLVTSPIDMIYIDPPYNTGSKSFRYSDSFGKRKHKDSEWAGFMWGRIRIGRDALSDEGLMFISIDDRELVTLRLICDHLFGERNFVGTLVWHSKYTVANDARFFSRQHEYIVVYAKDKKSARLGRLPRTSKSDAAYRNPDKDRRGPWKPTPLHAKSGSRTDSFRVAFPNGREWSPPAGRYPRFTTARLLEMYHEDRLWFGADGKSPPSAKTFLADVGGIVPGSVLSHSTVGHTHAANEQIAEILGKGQFDNPKPVELLTTLIRLGAPRPDAVILDYFAGSGTTAHAVANLNQEDGTHRQAVLCNSNENDICRSVTWERVRAVLTGRYPTGIEVPPLPGSLRYFKLDSA